MQEVSIPGIQTYSQAQLIRAFFQTARNGNQAFAAWQLPHEQEKHLIADTSGEATQLRAELDDLPSGFLFAPFEQEELPQGLFIRAAIHYKLNEEADEMLEPLKDPHNFHETFKRELDKPEKEFRPFSKPDFEREDSTEKEQFVQLVEQAVEAIRNGEFNKVVPSRLKRIKLPENFDPAATFLELCKVYPHAFISLVSIPGVGTWMGASPEILVKTNQQKQEFQTVALAGTQFVSPEVNLKTAAWRQKEIEEQAMVSRYIINCFKKIRLREFEEQGPKTVQAGNLLHLRTDFKVDMKSTNFPELGGVMLNLLHPTSAVCGMPKAEALGFLHQYEGYEREFYSGFLGPVNMSGKTDLFVNLRCMQLGEKHALLYAGAGVTADSEAEKEWIETEMKCKTLLNILHR